MAKMRIRFLKDYYGEQSGLLLMKAGDEGKFNEDVAQRLIAQGYAEKAEAQDAVPAQ